MIRVKVHLAESTTFASKPAATGIKVYQGMYSRLPTQRYNHFALEVEEVIYQSTFSGVGTELLDSFETHYKIKKTYEYELDIDIVDFKHWFSKYNGRHYDFLQIGNIWFRRSFGINLGIGHDDNNLICNEVYLLFSNEFVEETVAIKHIDKYDLVMSEDVLENHRKRGLCKVVKDWDDYIPKKRTSVIDDFLNQSLAVV